MAIQLLAKVIKFHHLRRKTLMKLTEGIPMTEEGAEKVKAFVPSKGLTSVEAQSLLEKFGRNELPEKKKPKV
jgi:hypothetical protein